MKETAEDISRSTGDGRTASYAGQLFARYQTLAESVRVRNCISICYHSFFSSYECVWLKIGYIYCNTSGYIDCNTSATTKKL